jgi:ABC-2 type transport system ATP-binding protein
VSLPATISQLDTEHPDAPEVVNVSGVSKRFVLRKDKSLKERVITLGRQGRKHREEFWALKNVNMSVKAGTTVGLIGHNGSGKSTLLKIIGGILDPSTGSVSRRGRIAALLELGAGFHPDLTGRENVYLNASIQGMSQEETDARFDDIVQFSGIGDFIDTQVKFYSSGMYVRLAFSVAVHTDPDLLLVDEVLAVGDEAFQRKCIEKIREFQSEGRTIVLVTHSLGQVTDLCDRAILLNQGEVMFDGAPPEAVTQFRDLLEDRRLDEQKSVELSDEQKNANEVHITGTTVHAAGKRVGEPVEVGDDLVVTVGLDHPTGFDNWNCAIRIDTPSWQVVFGVQTRQLGLKPDTLKGPTQVEFLIKDVRFGPGKYFINVSVMDEKYIHVADKPQAVSFNVPYRDNMTGVMYAEPSASVTAGTSGHA